MTLTFGSWIGIPAVPFVTLYNNRISAAGLAGLGVVNPSVRLGCLPLWGVMRSLGQTQIRARVPPYTDNLNSWLGQILQRDAPHIAVEIVDVETTGYVLRLCPFEDVAMVGMSS